VNLKETISRDLKTAMKEQDRLRLATLRLASSSITYAEKEKRRELTDEELLEVVIREVKRRREAIEEYDKAGRADLADKERAEAEILNAYMPEQLTDAAVETMVKQAIEATGASGPGDIGKVMGVVIPQTKGRADGKKINEIVRGLLA
jgi:uncharacterized protein YqeY